MKRTSRTTRIAVMGARAVAGAAVIVLCIAGVTVAVAAPWPQIENSPATTEVTPLPGDTVLVCTGSFRALGRDVQSAGQMSAAGDLRATTAGDGVVVAQTELLTPELEDGIAPTALTSIAEGRQTPLIAASESIRLDSEDLAGLAAAPCREPATESWIVGGEVSTGTSDIVILSNPGEVTATVTLTVYGVTRTSTTTVVAAGTQVALPLAGIAAGEQEPVVRVTTEGSPIRAVLQSSLVRTLDPVGIDLQDTAGAPRNELTFAAVRVVVEEQESAPTLVRMLAPDEDTEATVTVRAAGETVEEFTVPLTGGAPASVSLADLPIGVYSVDVVADEPIVGATWQSAGFGEVSDFSWMTAAPELAGTVMFSVPRGPAPRLHLVNGGDSDVTVSVAPQSGGTEREIVVPAGTDELVTVRPNSSYELTTSGPLHAAISMADDGQLAGWPIWPGTGEPEPIVVHP